MLKFKMTTIKEIKLEYGKQNEEIYPLLRGRIFHVTCPENYQLIVRDEAISPSPKERVHHPFGKYNSYMAHKGCVSLFDLKNPSDKEIEKNIHKCHPLQPASRDLRQVDDAGTVYIIMIKDDYKFDPLTVKDWKGDGAYRFQIVPYIEIGHPGHIDLKLTQEHLRVTVTRKTPPTPHEEALYRAWENAKRNAAIARAAADIIDDDPS